MAERDPSKIWCKLHKVEIPIAKPHKLGCYPTNQGRQCPDCDAESSEDYCSHVQKPDMRYVNTLIR